MKSSEVAKLVGVTNASTATMTERLVESGFIEKEYYGRISLTESGIRTASPIFTNCVAYAEPADTAVSFATSLIAVLASFFLKRHQ